MFTTSFQGLVLLSRPSSKDLSTLLLVVLAMTSSVIETGIHMTLDLISVQVNGFKPSSSLIFPPRVGSIRTFSCSSILAA